MDFRNWDFEISLEGLDKTYKKQIKACLKELEEMDVDYEIDDSKISFAYKDFSEIVCQLLKSINSESLSIAVRNQKDVGCLKLQK